MTTRIYAACLASYNNGILYGAWIDCEDKDGDDIRAEISTMLQGSRILDAEEWAIHDHEGFGNLIKSEYPDLDQIAALAVVLSGDDEHAKAGLRWLIEDNGSDVDSAIEECGNVRFHQCDAFNIARDYAQEIIEELIGCELSSLPPIIQDNIDYDGIATDLKNEGAIAEYRDIDLGCVLITNAIDF